MKYISLIILLTLSTYKSQASFFTKNSLVLISDSNKIVTEIKDIFDTEEQKQLALSKQSAKPQFYTSAGYTVHLPSGNDIDLELGYKKDFISKLYQTKSNDPENFLDLLTKCKTQIGIASISYIFDIPNNLNLKPFISLGTGVSFTKIKLLAVNSITTQDNAINLNKLIHTISTGQISIGMSIPVVENFELISSYSLNSKIYGSDAIQNISMSIPDMVLAKANIIKPNTQHALSFGIKFNT